jgi:hypothetical protein
VWQASYRGQESASADEWKIFEKNQNPLKTNTYENYQPYVCWRLTTLS